MIKLINADELIAVFDSRSTINVVGDGLCKAIISQIEGQPTVDAIPIEYMQSQVDCGKWAEIIQRWREHETDKR